MSTCLSLVVFNYQITNRSNKATTSMFNILKHSLHISILLLLLSIISSAEDSSTEYSNKEVKSICTRCTCITIGDLFSADCDDAGLTEIPPFRHGLHVYWSLRLVGNAIKEVSKFPPLVNLTSIVLKYNYIETIVDDAFSELPKLNNLDLSHNKITWQTLDSEAFRGKYQSGGGPNPLPVTHLNMSHNHIQKLSEHAFEYLSKVVTLDISHNPFHDFSQNTANAFTELISLETLNLAYAHLVRLPNHFFAELSNLKELDLSGNSFTVIPPELNYARYIQTLKLDDNLFGTLGGPNSFGAGLAELRFLYMRGSQSLFNIEAGAFSNLTNLEKLFLNNNDQLEYLWNGAFGSPKSIKLQELHLNNNQLYIISEELIDWYDIPLVDIQNNPWHCDCQFEWVAKGLVPRMTEVNREITKNVVCHSPAHLKGHSVSDDTVQRDSFKCQPLEYKSTKPSSMLVIGVIIVGAIILITGSLILAFLLVKKTRARDWIGDKVKYRRATNDEEDIIASTVQY